MELSKITTNLVHCAKSASIKGARFLAVLVLMVSTVSTALLLPGVAQSTAAESQLITLAVPLDSDQMPATSPSVPLAFMENVGQFDERAHFQARSGNTTLYLANDALWVTVMEPSPQPDFASDMEALSAVGQEADERASRRVNLKLSFVGANPHPRLEPFDKLDTRVSFFTGSDPAQWRTSVPAWGGVRYVDLYPGVDMEIASQNGRLAQRLVVRDHSLLQNVRLRVEGADNLTLDNDHLRLTTALGDLSLPLLPIEGAIPETQPAVLNVERGTFEVLSPFATASAFTGVSARDLPSSLNDGLLVYYSFDTNGGGTFTDESGSGNDGAVVGTPTYTTQGKFGGAYDFKKHDYIALDSNPTAGLGTFAVSLWFKTNTPTNNYKIASAASWNWGSGSGWIVGTHYPEAWSSDGNSIMVGSCPRAVSFVAGDWNHVVISYDGDRFKEYINGQVSKDCATTGLSLGDGRNLEVGAWSQYSGYDYEGLIDEFRVYDRALSADEVSMLYDPGGAYPDYDWAYSTYLGGSGDDRGLDIAVDSAGHAYITGQTSSVDFPTTPGAYDTSYNGDPWDVFVVKLSLNGNTLLYTTYLGGDSDDGSGGIVVDNAGNVYVTGATWSANFPTTDGVWDRNLSGGRDGFVTKLNAAGDELLYSTYLGDNSWDYGRCIAVDSDGHAYVGGFTHGSFPITSGAAQATFGGSGDGFAVKLSPDGSMLLYSTYLGGYSWESIDGIAIDNAGNAYLASGTHSTDFPTTPGAWDRTCDNCQTNVSTDAAVAKLNADGSEFIYSTLIGGATSPGGESFEDIAVDNMGNAYVVGRTSSTDFPTTAKALQPDFGGGSRDAVVTKLNADGSALLYSTYLGGSDGDDGYDIVIDSVGNAYVTGRTTSTDFPTVVPLQPTNGGAYDAFVAKLDADGDALLYSTYLGGSGDENFFGTEPHGLAGAITLDDAGNIYLTGLTASPDFPTTDNVLQPTFGGGDYDAFVVKMGDGSRPTLSIPSNIPAYPGMAVSVSVNFTGNGHNIASTAFSVDFDQTCLAFDPTDDDQNGVPDAITFNLPDGFDAAVTFDGSDADGELDFSILDPAPPLASLLDGSVSTIAFSATCQPAPGINVTAPVEFSDHPKASFGGTSGQSIPGVTIAGSVQVLSSTPGDCNGDLVVDAGDLSALVLEIFDGDGDNLWDTPGGTFAGNPACDANRDTVVDAGDISCTVLIIFDGPGACSGGSGLTSMADLPTSPSPAALDGGPRLSIPAQMPVSPEGQVTLPISFAANGYNISSLIFSVDYDETWLAFDPADNDQDGIPDAVTFNVPDTLSVSVTFDEGDTDGELDFVIADFSAPLTSLPNGTIASITLNITGTSSATEVTVNFSQEPAASFGNTSGQSIPGITDRGPTGIYLPIILQGIGPLEDFGR